MSPSFPEEKLKVLNGVVGSNVVLKLINVNGNIFAIGYRSLKNSSL